MLVLVSYTGFKTASVPDNDVWHSVGPAQSSCPCCGRSNEADKAGNKTMLQSSVQEEKEN